MRKMQKIIILFILLSPFTAFAAGEGQSLRGIADEIYRLSEEMVHHGGEGHTDEIVQYGEKMVERIAVLIKRIQGIDQLKGSRQEIIVSLTLTRDKTEEAIRLGKKNLELAYQAARKASFQAKKSRQKIHALP
jgi:hypothetical protein